MSEIKRIDIKEFREEGFLQEVNRAFLHPRGLALEVIVDDNTGEERLGGIWDYRDDPEGITFGGGMIDSAKILRSNAEREKHALARQKLFDGIIIQPADWKES